MFSLISPWINDWVNNHREAGELKRHGTHYDVIVMYHYNASQHNALHTAMKNLEYKMKFELIKENPWFALMDELFDF